MPDEKVSLFILAVLNMSVYCRTQALAFRGAGGEPPRS
ncbi:hypothetical protein KP78_18050 [Jeotgalibacillus soli]|uniref:Uncharacterized protein n=1 Tax=Jeotgalibacillus soli TaxID=889306 RepID=A0A0C2VE70_9BACL|nr:hypothetical protein KP78_18050 [Jeotgalibacillus soli]